MCAVPLYLPLVRVWRAAEKQTQTACGQLPAPVAHTAFSLPSLHTCAVLCLLPYWSAALGVASPAVRVFAVAQLLSVPLLCAWSDTRGTAAGSQRASRRRTALLLSCATSALAWLTLARATDPLALVAAAAALGASAGVAPLAYAHCGDVINAGTWRPGEAAAVSPAWTAATLALAAGVGAALAPSLAAQAAQAGGLGAAASAAAGVAALSALLVVLVVRSDTMDSWQLAVDAEDAADEADGEPAPAPGSGQGAATHLLLVRALLAGVMATVALAMGPRHSVLFALPPPVSSQLGAAWTTAQLVTWATVAPAAVRLARGPGMLQTASCGAAALCLTAWLAATSPSAVALPLAGLALAGALARTANDTLLLTSTASGPGRRPRPGAVFGLAWAAQEGVRLLLVPAALTALAPGSPDGGAALMAGIAAACVATVGGAAYQLARSRERAVEEEADSTLWAEDAVGCTEVDAAASRAARAGAGLAQGDVTDAGGEGQFTGTVVMRRPRAPPAAVAVPDDESAQVSALVQELLAAEAGVQISRTVLMARRAAVEAAVVGDLVRRGVAGGQ